MAAGDGPKRRDLPMWAVVAVAAVMVPCAVAGGVAATIAPREQSAAPPAVPRGFGAPVVEAPDEARVQALLATCRPGSPGCFSEVLAGATGDTAATRERARVACRNHYEVALGFTPAMLEQQTPEALDVIRRNAFCLRALGGNPTFTIADVDQAHSVAVRRLVMPGYQGGVEGWGGGYSRGGRGRCRDSRGRFTRCY